jgi:hypothetical protein
MDDEDDWGEEEGCGSALDFMTMRMADGQHPVLQLLLSGSLVNLIDKAPIEGRGLCSWAPLLLDR